MAQKFVVRQTAERFIHNDLSNCAWWFHSQANRKFETSETEGVALDMMASLVFCAFSIEAKVNFVGWKHLENGWPDRANIFEKLDLLNKVLDAQLVWGSRPLQTVKQLFKIRNTLAHGKPEVIDDEEKIMDVEPDIWEALRSDWEASINIEFLDRCREDERHLWNALLESAGIQRQHTITNGHNSVEALIKAAEQ